jgi:hypothetical protein
MQLGEKRQKGCGFVRSFFVAFIPSAETIKKASQEKFLSDAVMLN